MSPRDFGGMRTELGVGVGRADGSVGALDEAGDLEPYGVRSEGQAFRRTGCAF